MSLLAVGLDKYLVSVAQARVSLRSRTVNSEGWLLFGIQRKRGPEEKEELRVEKLR